MHEQTQTVHHFPLGFIYMIQQKRNHDEAT